MRSCIQAEPGLFELLDYYLVTATSAGGGEPGDPGEPGPDFHLGPLRSVRPHRVAFVAAAEPAQQAAGIPHTLGSLRPGRWWPDPDEVIETARGFYPGRPKRPGGGHRSGQQDPRPARCRGGLPRQSPVRRAHFPAGCPLSRMFVQVRALNERAAVIPARPAKDEALESLFGPVLVFPRIGVSRRISIIPRAGGDLLIIDSPRRSLWRTMGVKVGGVASAGQRSPTRSGRRCDGSRFGRR
jgi:hypothetical protein